MRDAPPVAAVREGYELHYGSPGRPHGRPDLALLGGRPPLRPGLDELAAAGDLEAVARAAEVIAASPPRSGRRRGAR